MIKKILFVVAAIIIISLIAKSDVFQKIIHALNLNELTLNNIKNLF